jgi:hypothetical protein
MDSMSPGQSSQCLRAHNPHENLEFLDRQVTLWYMNRSSKSPSNSSLYRAQAALELPLGSRRVFHEGGAQDSREVGPS